MLQLLPSSATMATDQQLVILRQAIDESLHSLGEPIKKTVVWHLNLNGIFTESDQFDLASFYETLEDIMGNGAEVVIHVVYGILAKHKEFALVGDPHRSLVDRILDSMKKDGGMGSE